MADFRILSLCENTATVPELLSPGTAVSDKTQYQLYIEDIRDPDTKFFRRRVNTQKVEVSINADLEVYFEDGSVAHGLPRPGDFSAVSTKLVGLGGVIHQQITKEFFVHEPGVEPIEHVFYEQIEVEMSEVDCYPVDGDGVPIPGAPAEPQRHWAKVEVSVNFQLHHWQQSEEPRRIYCRINALYVQVIDVYPQDGFVFVYPVDTINESGAEPTPRVTDRYSFDHLNDAGAYVDVGFWGPGNCGTIYDALNTPATDPNGDPMGSVRIRQLEPDSEFRFCTLTIHAMYVAASVSRLAPDSL